MVRVLRRSGKSCYPLLWQVVDFLVIYITGQNDLNLLNYKNDLNYLPYRYYQVYLGWSVPQSKAQKFWIKNKKL